MTDGFTMNIRVINDGLPRIIAGMMPVARAAVAKAAMDIEAGAKMRAPVDTGTLRNSIQAQQVGGNSSSGSVRWQVKVGASYGVYVEWGTRFMGARPFLRPAVNEVAPSFMAAMRKVTTP